MIMSVLYHITVKQLLRIEFCVRYDGQTISLNSKDETHE